MRSSRYTAKWSSATRTTPLKVAYAVVDKLDSPLRGWNQWVPAAHRGVKTLDIPATGPRLLLRCESGPARERERRTGAHGRLPTDQALVSCGPQGEGRGAGMRPHPAA